MPAGTGDGAGIGAERDSLAWFLELIVLTALNSVQRQQKLAIGNSLTLLADLQTFIFFFLCTISLSCSERFSFLCSFVFYSAFYFQLQLCFHNFLLLFL